MASPGTPSTASSTGRGGNWSERDGVNSEGIGFLSKRTFVSDSSPRSRKLRIPAQQAKLIEPRNLGVLLDEYNLRISSDCSSSEKKQVVHKHLDESSRSERVVTRFLQSTDPFVEEASSSRRHPSQSPQRQYSPDLNFPDDDVVDVLRELNNLFEGFSDNARRRMVKKIMVLAFNRNCQIHTSVRNNTCVKTNEVEIVTQGKTHNFTVAHSRTVECVPNIKFTVTDFTAQSTH